MPRYPANRAIVVRANANRGPLSLISPAVRSAATPLRRRCPAASAARAARTAWNCGCVKTTAVPGRGGSETSRRATSCTRVSIPKPSAALTIRPSGRSRRGAGTRSHLLCATTAPGHSASSVSSALGPGCGNVEHQDDQVRLLELLARPLDARDLDFVPAVAQARRVRQFHRPAVQRGVGGHHVARRARLGVHDASLEAQDGVDQTALAHVRPSRQNDAPGLGQVQAHVGTLLQVAQNHRRLGRVAARGCASPLPSATIAGRLATDPTRRRPRVRYAPPPRPRGPPPRCGPRPVGLPDPAKESLRSLRLPANRRSSEPRAGRRGNGFPLRPSRGGKPRSPRPLLPTLPSDRRQFGRRGNHPAVGPRLRGTTRPRAPSPAVRSTKIVATAPRPGGVRMAT